MAMAAFSPAGALDDGKLEQMGLNKDLGDKRRSDVLCIKEMFPDAEPLWIVDKLEEYSIDELIDRMIADPASYDKVKKKTRKSMQAEELNQSRREDLLDRSKFDVAQLLRVYADPAAHFGAKDAELSFLYRDHAIVALKNEFNMLRIDYITRILRQNHGHFYSAYKQIETLVKGRKKTDKGKYVLGYPFLNAIRQNVYPWPETIDVAFFKELQYAKWEDDVKEYQRSLNEVRAKQIAEATAQGTLAECACCYLDDCLPSEMIACSNKHAFCKACVAEMVEAKLTDGCYNMVCLGEKCDERYDASVLRHIVKPTSFDRLIHNIQQFELRQADIANLCSCPFCDFAMVIDNPHEKLFSCLNPDCLKVSCRSCKDLSHIPLRCSEVEKDDNVRMRTYVEEQCAKALIRNCPHCDKPIIKESGCNKMVCPCCQTHFCYQCSTQLDKDSPYTHFADGTRYGGKIDPKTSKVCKTYTSMKEVHEDAAMRAGLEARKKYLEEHPEMKEKATGLDVQALVDKVKLPQQENMALPQSPGVAPQARGRGRAFGRGAEPQRNHPFGAQAQARPVDDVQQRLQNELNLGGAGHGRPFNDAYQHNGANVRSPEPANWRQDNRYRPPPPLPPRFFPAAPNHQPNQAAPFNYQGALEAQPFRLRPDAAPFQPRAQAQPYQHPPLPRPLFPPQLPNMGSPQRQPFRNNNVFWGHM